MSTVDAVPPQFRAGNDGWSQLPLHSLAYGQYIAEVGEASLSAGLPIPRAAIMAPRFLAMLYIGSSSFDRSRRAEQFQVHPELRRYMARRAALESLAREWLCCVTLPSLCAGAIFGAARASILRRSAALSQRFASYAPGAIALASAPAVVYVSELCADVPWMEYTVRPLLDEWMPPPGTH